jgi:hypothetical protein
MIKAIETEYKGYRFRSRLEARWAVFFDTLGIAWEYEPQGFDLTEAYRDYTLTQDYRPLSQLKSGERLLYLPDFYLPLQKRYVEIKPYGGPEWWGSGYPLLYEKICDLLGGWLVHGNPGTKKDETYEICTSGDVSYWFGYCPRCGTFNAGYGAWAERICKDHEKCGYHQKDDLSCTPPMLAAIAAARSARFEHGEHGAR